MSSAHPGAAVLHPSAALFEPGETQPVPLPACDHYAGVEARMRKALSLQAERGPVFDVTLDAEDGAPVGAEAEHMALIAELIGSNANVHSRAGARVHPVRHPAFGPDVEHLVRQAGPRLAFIMLPKPEHLGDVMLAVEEIDRLSSAANLARSIPIHVLIETHGALREVAAIAAHPRVESVSFGLMDFVSAHRGAIPSSAMGMPGQFEHPLICRAKLEISAAAHASGKTPSHNVVTEFRDRAVLAKAVLWARERFGYTRMWSIHPEQIEVIVGGMAPHADEVTLASDVLLAAQEAHWGPVSHRQTLHDRASYRYFWHVLQQAWRSGQLRDQSVKARFFAGG